ncbi:MAG: polyprenyl diphosphate synthase [bacterium]
MSEKENTTLKIPQHMAIIMDGNGRWAKQKNKLRSHGHQEGSKALERCIEYCIEFNIKYLSAYTFSTENWNRPKKEIDFLMTLLYNSINKQIPKLKEKKINLNFFGSLEKLSPKIQTLIKTTQQYHQQNPKLTLNILLSYGSKAEILNACKSLLNKKINPQDLTEEMFTNHLWTKNIPEPDILVRTGGEYRISNFMLWQCAYTELIFIKENWPDFSKQTFTNILNIYNKRQRRFGRL